jgi:hypothetical protein
MMMKYRPEYQHQYRRAATAAGSEEETAGVVLSIVENILVFVSEGTCLLFVMAL